MSKNNIPRYKSFEPTIESKDNIKIPNFEDKSLSQAVVTLSDKEELELTGSDKKTNSGCCEIL